MAWSLLSTGTSEKVGTWCDLDFLPGARPRSNLRPVLVGQAFHAFLHRLRARARMTASIDSCSTPEVEQFSQQGQSWTTLVAIQNHQLQVLLLHSIGHPPQGSWLHTQAFNYLMHNHIFVSHSHLLIHLQEPSVRLRTQRSMNSTFSYPTPPSPPLRLSTSQLPFLLSHPLSQ